MRKLEAAVHQFKNNPEKTLKWLTRYGYEGKVAERITNKLFLGEFLYYTGSDLEILPNTTRTYTLAQED